MDEMAEQLAGMKDEKNVQNFSRKTRMGGATLED
jgi:hypothetical protein